MNLQDPPLAVSSILPVLIRMIYSEENVIFDCTVDNGYFYYEIDNGYFYLGTSVCSKYLSLHTGGVARCYVDSGTIVERQTIAFIEILLKSAENIIGYTVLEVFKKTKPIGPMVFDAIPLKSVLFPQVDGKYQEISEEYVKTAIERIKDDNKGDDL